MKYISLYSGCGGLDYGFHEAGFNLVFANDIDKDSCITFEDNFSFEPRNYDLNKISLKEIPKADIVIGGPPCQSFSFLGKRAIFDERGKEIFNFFKVVEKVRPKIFLMENVPGVRSSSMNDLGLIDYLLKEMEKVVKHLFLDLIAQRFIFLKPKRIFLSGGKIIRLKWNWII